VLGVWLDVDGIRDRGKKVFLHQFIIQTGSPLASVGLYIYPMDNLFSTVSSDY